MNRRHEQRGFTLVELIIVIIVIAILAALAIPNFTVSAQDAKVSTLSGDLAVMRNAISLYYHQHNGTWPGQKDEATGAAVAAAADAKDAFIAQLTQYSDADGKTSTDVDASYPYGPYLVKGLPANPIVGSADVRAVDVVGPPTYDSNNQDEGWVYAYKSGRIIANHDDYDDL